MNSPEATIIVINAMLTLVAYFVVYPKLVGDDVNKLLGYDMVVTALALGIAGYLFWNSGIRFSIFVADVNWFWFALITYALLETPLLLGYMKQRNMQLTPNNSDQ